MAFRCGVCSTNEETDVRSCTYRSVVKKLIYPRCARSNLLCSALRGAYVSPVTVCRQRLF